MSWTSSARLVSATRVIKPSAKPRLRCAVCGELYTLTVPGALHAHQVMGAGGYSQLCPGADRPAYLVEPAAEPLPVKFVTRVLRAQAVCPHCARLFTVNPSGHLRYHRVDREVCPGAWSKPPAAPRGSAG